MTTRFHGVTSIGLVLVAVVIAAVTGFQSSPVLGLVYLLGCAVAPLGIVYAYCAKCPCRTHCAHVIFGKLAVAFTNRQPGPYAKTTTISVLVALLWLLGLPQVWLWQYSVLGELRPVRREVQGNAAQPPSQFPQPAIRPAL